MRSSRGDIGLATLRPEVFDAVLTSGEAILTPRPPAWLRLADSEVVGMS